MSKKGLILKTSVILLAMAVTFFGFIVNVPETYGLQCFAKGCEVGGKDCACCLITLGTIYCSPCGQLDCPPDP